MPKYTGFGPGEFFLETFTIFLSNNTFIQNKTTRNLSLLRLPQRILDGFEEILCVVGGGGGGFFWKEGGERWNKYICNTMALWNYWKENLNQEEKIYLIKSKISNEHWCDLEFEKNISIQTRESIIKTQFYHSQKPLQ